VVQVAVKNENASGGPSDLNKNEAPALNSPDTLRDGNLAGAQANAGGDRVKAAAPAATQRNRQAVALTPAQLVRDAEQKYLTAIAMLSRDVNRRRSQLDPIMLARFDASLSQIDNTIKETRQVVRGNPEDPIALQYLLAAYSKKVDVLREMTNN